jgi:hypothetical protein
MRAEQLSHQPTSFWPMKLAASRPVRKIISQGQQRAGAGNGEADQRLRVNRFRQQAQRLIQRA